MRTTALAILRRASVAVARDFTASAVGGALHSEDRSNKY